MGLVILAFIAGILTVLAPCVIPILPVILGASSEQKSWKKPLIVILSLAFSIFILTLSIKLLADFAGFNPSNLKFLTVIVLTLFGLILIFPNLWDKLNFKLNLSGKSDGLLNEFAKKDGILGYMLVGFSLGPVFNSCSPTYLLLILPIIEQNLLEGMFYLVFYLLGLILILSLIAILGNKLTRSIKWAYNPQGLFRKVLGVLFILIAIAVAFGIDKRIETYLLKNTDFYVNLINFEVSLQESLM